ncbi:MAG: phosphoglycerate kinase [Candidatus Peribacteraceae bacterium]|nr:phosphoglycerate kinase [Candidatus Peribacteraceae bacterium]
MTTYRTLDKADLKGKRVLLRAGFDVSVEDGKVTDATRIEAIQKTMKYIIDSGALLIIMAHQGRPKDAPDPIFSQKPLVPVLKTLLGTTVHFASDCIGSDAESVIAKAKAGEVVLLENLRFHPEEKKNDPEFAKKLAALADIYVNDAFTNCHRAHASMVGVAKLLPAYMGFNLEQEVMHLSKVLDAPKHPLTLIISGAKMETKVPVIEKFLHLGDNILLGGCIANTFIAARGFAVGKSKYEAEALPQAQGFLTDSQKEGSAKIHVPTDVIVAAELSETAQGSNVSTEHIEGDLSIFDIGTESAKQYADIIEKSSMIIWNGPIGVYEFKNFSAASKVIAQAIARATAKGAMSIIGGGDTIDFHMRYNLPLAYTFVSMGGGAMLEFLAGEKFESLAVLEG